MERADRCPDKSSSGTEGDHAHHDSIALTGRPADKFGAESEGMSLKGASLNARERRARRKGKQLKCSM
eukprot:5278968-Pleurochrysis_carterae.AAC.1